MPRYKTVLPSGKSPTPNSPGPVIEGFAIKFDAVAAGGVFTVRVPVPDGFMVEEVRVVKQTAFDGTSPTITVGDADNATGFMTSANLAPASTGALQSASFANAYQNGRLNDSGARRDVLVVYTRPANNTAGQLVGHVILTPYPDLGIGNMGG